MYSKFDQALHRVGGVVSILNMMEIALFYADEDSMKISTFDVSGACDLLHDVLKNAHENLIDSSSRKEAAE